MCFYKSVSVAYGAVGTERYLFEIEEVLEVFYERASEVSLCISVSRNPLLIRHLHLLQSVLFFEVVKPIISPMRKGLL